MNKKMFVGLAALAVLASSAAFADDVSGGLNVGRDGQRYYVANYAHNAGENLVVGIQAETLRSDANAIMAENFSTSLGYKLALPYDITVVPNVEFGVNLGTDVNVSVTECRRCADDLVEVSTKATNDTFYGASVSVSRKVYGPLSLALAYRYRYLDNSDIAQKNENRGSASLVLAINDKSSVSLNGYSYDKGNEALSHVYGLSYKYTF